MKKGPRCPTCKSLSIKELPLEEEKNKTQGELDDKACGEVKKKWRCYDCYRIFEKPDEAVYDTKK